jgi:hypothetical protein
VSTARPLISLHALQQVADFDVGVAVVAVLDLGALAEQGVGFVEEQDGAAVFGGVENLAQVLLGFADVFADHGRQVDAVEVELQGVGQHLGGERLAGAALAGEQRGEAEAAAALGGEAPFFLDLEALAQVGGNLAQHGELGFRQDEAVPVGRRFEALGEIVESAAAFLAATVPQRAWRSGLCFSGSGWDGEAGLQGFCNALDGPAAEAEMAGGTVEFRPGVVHAGGAESVDP